MEPDVLLSVQFIICFIAIGFGLCLVVGQLLGFGHDVDSDADADADVDADVDHDFDMDHDHDFDHDHDIGHDGGHSVYQNALMLLGVGRVPIMAIMMFMSLFFGVFGFVFNLWAEKAWITFPLYWLVTMPAAFAIAFFLTGVFARIWHRIMPSTETYVISDRDLLGKTGELEYSADATSGRVHVRDDGGSLHVLSCRTTGAEFPRGTKVMLMELESDGTFIVTETEID